MNINNRLVDRLIASTALNATLVTGLNDAATKGPIVASIGLDKIAENISINMANLPGSASHARPSMLASVSSFAGNIRTALDALAPGKTAADYQALSSTCKQDFVEWQAMVAIVALCNIYSGSGLKLSVDPFLLDSEDLVQRCILREMDKDDCYRGAITKRNLETNEPVEGCLHYICQNGKPFALYHPEIGLCPMKCYDARMFEGIVDWYLEGAEQCHTAWKPILEFQPTGRGGSTWKSCLDDFCLSRIAWWAGQNRLRQYQTFVQNSMADSSMTLDDALANPNSVEGVASINNVWENKGTAFGTSMMFYLNAQGVACPMPKLFLNTLLITYTGGQSNNRQIYNTSSSEQTVAFIGNHPELEELAPVAPLSSAVMEMLETGTLEKLTFDPVLEGGKLRSVRVDVTIRTDQNSSFTMHKTYDADHLRFGKLPYLMLWPFVPMPEGKKLWKKYFATWQDNDKSLTALPKANGGYVQLVVDMRFDFKDQGTATKVYRPPNDQQSWTVCTNNSQFRYAMVEGTVKDEWTTLGIVFMPKYPTYNPEGNDVSAVNVEPVQLAVDFGTTSTVCAMRSSYLNKGEITPLSFQDYGRAVTCYDADAKRTLDMDHWLGNTAGGADWEKNTKIFSVAQLFEHKEGGGPNRKIMSDAKEQKYYVDGRMFLISGGAMINYATPSSNDQDPLQKQQIMNDMKFNEKLDVKNYQAATIFLAGVYTYAVLYLLSQKIIPGQCPYLQLRASYPNTVTLDALKKNWSYAKNILDDLIDEESKITEAINTLVNGTQHFYSEAIATSAYQRNANVAVQAARHLVSLDIGGGTTDISITSTLYPKRTENLSFRYAGREIMVSSLIAYYRRFAEGAQYGLDTEFKEIWQNADELVLEQFHKIRKAGGDSPSNTFLHSLLTNSSARMDVELLLSEGMHLKPVEVSDSTNLIRQIITLKFLMVLRLTACAVKEHIDMWKLPDTGVLDTIDNQLMIDLSISGTSAQLLQYVFDCSMDDLQTLNSKKCAGHIAACKALFADIFTDILSSEIGPDVGINLQLHVDANVKEKREVCYGMLQSNIEDYHKTPAHAPLEQQTRKPGGVWAIKPAQIKQAVDADDDADSTRKEKISKMKAYLDNFPQDLLKTYIYGETNDDDSMYVKLGLLPYMLCYQNDVMKIDPNTPPSNRGLGERIQNITDLLSRYSSTSLSLGKFGVKETRAAYMVEPEQAPYRDELACMYLVDEILDWEMIDRQV